MFSRRTHLAVAIAAACSFNHAVASEQEQLELDAQTVVGDSEAAEVDSYKSSPSSAATKLDLTRDLARLHLRQDEMEKAAALLRWEVGALVEEDLDALAAEGVGNHGPGSGDCLKIARVRLPHSLGDAMMY